MNDRRDDNEPDEAARLEYERTKEEFLAAIDQPESTVDHSTVSDSLGKLLSMHHLGEQYFDQGLAAPPFAELLNCSPDGCVGDFKLLEILGRGGMGVVYRAQQVTTSRVVAVKFLRPSLNNARFRERFEREVKVIQRLDHPGICRFVGSGTIESTLGEMPYLALDFVEGQTLSHYVEAVAADVPTRVGLVISLCEALSHAHGYGVVHCDLKPANILVRDDGTPCVLDFGIASLVLADGIEAVDGGTLTLLGTMSFMSPEQLHKGFGAVDLRSDIFSLGVILYELLTGHLPFGDNNDPPAHILGAVLLDSPPPIVEFSPDLSPALERILGGCLVKEPALRYASTEALAGDLRRFLQGQSPRGGRSAPRFPFLRKWGVRWAAVAVLIVMIGAGLHQEIGYIEGNRSLGRLDMYLEAADQGIHLGPQSEASLAQAIQSLMLAKRELPRLTGKHWEQAVERYIDWRLGEAHLFLGQRLDDAENIRLARADFARAYGRELTNYSVENSPLPPTLLARIVCLKPHHPPGGRALAHESLARYEWPRAHLTRAVALRKEALAAWAALEAPGQDPFDVVEPAPFLFHDCGRDLVLLGRLLEDSDSVAEGMRYLLHVDDESVWSPAANLGRAAFMESVGWARWAEAELDGDSSKYALAEQRMFGAMAARRGDAPSAQASTRLALAEIALDWAVRDDQVRGNQLALARLQSVKALQTFAGADHFEGVFRARLVLGKIELVEGHIDAVRELLATLAAADMTRLRRPALRAEMVLLKADLAAQTCVGGAAALTAIRDLMIADNPRQHHRAEAVQSRLKDCSYRR